MKKRALLFIPVLALSFMILQPGLIFAKQAEAAPASVGGEVVKVNLNKAGLEELESIRGVGPALAERILAYRSENGGFKSLEDLMNVKGIGQGKFDRIKDQITV